MQYFHPKQEQFIQFRANIKFYVWFERKIGIGRPIIVCQFVPYTPSASNTTDEDTPQCVY